MTENQFIHYIKGGIFKGIYNPKIISDLDNVEEVNNNLEFYQNCLITPILDKKYNEQFRFNSDNIKGWLPEEDIDNLEIIENSYIEVVESIPKYLYRITYADKDGILTNFGNINFEIPFTIHREYDQNNDDYIINKLSNPQANKVEKATWEGKYKEKIKWLKF